MSSLNDSSFQCPRPCEKGMQVQCQEDCPLWRGFLAKGEHCDEQDGDDKYSKEKTFIS